MLIGNKNCIFHTRFNRLLMKYILTIGLVFVCAQLMAQEDSLFVFPHSNSFSIMYTSQNGETIFTLSRRFHVPPAILADANGLTYQSGIANNTLLIIPLGAYNQLKDKPAHMGDAKALYYHVRDEDDLYKVSKYSVATESELADWNHISRNTVKRGQTLFVGWVLFDATGYTPTAKQTISVSSANTNPSKQATTAVTKNAITPNPATLQNLKKKYVQNKDGTLTAVYVPEPVDTPKIVDSLYFTSPFGKLYLQQTDSGRSLDSEKGATVFFDAKVSATKNMFYAFSNTTERGTVIKVYNSNSQKTILVKVIGAIPDSKQYYNSTLAITYAAKDALQIKEDKAWCELWFGKANKKPVPPASSTPPVK